MIKKYNNYIKENINNDKNYLLTYPFINEYTTIKNNGKLNIRTINPSTYKQDLLKQNRVTPLNYASLFRFLIFAWVYKYKGDSSIIINLKNELDKNGDQDLIRIINQMPRNRKIIGLIGKLIGTYSTNEEDYGKISNLLKKKDIIFTEENFIKWFNIIQDITNIANKSEDDVITLINSNPKIPYSDANPANPNQDIGGIDVIALNYRKERTTIQVKRIGGDSNLISKWTSEKKYTYIIFNSTLDINNYNKWDDGHLSYDVLLLDNKDEIIIINSKAISRIFRDDKKNNIFIDLYLSTKEWFPKMVKTFKKK